MLSHHPSLKKPLIKKFNKKIKTPQANFTFVKICLRTCTNFFQKFVPIQKDYYNKKLKSINMD